MNITRKLWKRQEATLDRLIRAMNQKGLDYQVSVNNACPNVKLLDESWTFFVTNQGNIIACPRSGQLHQYDCDHNSPETILKEILLK